MKSILSFFISFFLVLSTNSQISLDQDDWPFAGFNRDYIEASADSIDVGQAGQNVTFDFSVLTNVYDTFNVEFLDMQGDLHPNHPTATIGYLSDHMEDSATNQTVLEIWNYVRSLSTSAMVHGNKIRVDTGYLFSQSPPSGMIDVYVDYDPRMTIMEAGLNYQSGKLFMGSWEVQLGDFKHTESYSKNIEMDAFGTFINPWEEYDAIRLKVVEINTGIDSIDGVQTDMWVDTMHYFEYWIKDFGYYLAKAYTNDDHTMVYGIDLAVYMSPQGLPALPENKINVWPNPASEELNIQLREGSYQYRIFDGTGKLMSEGMLRKSQEVERINLSELSPGIYILEFRNPTNSERISHRFVKE